MELYKPFAETFDAARLRLFASEHWTVLVRPKQVTLGSLVLAANRHVLSAGELTDDEMLDLRATIARLERMLGAAFAFDRINYLCLMMKDQHYHFHVLPRYAASRQFVGRDWADPSWPLAPSLEAVSADDTTLLALVSRLRAVDAARP